MITRISIRNFRSIVSSEFEPRSYNTLVGGNDSGKSNYLRALNLFFNDEVEIGVPFQFKRDFCRSAKTGKGKAQEVRIELRFKPPENYKTSDEVVWRKTWRAEKSEFMSDEKHFSSKEPIPGRSKIHPWLDAHRFHYIPAVRGAEFFKSLLRDIHDTLVESYESELRTSSQSFVTDLRKHTSQIGSVIRDQLGLNSEIQLPPDLSALFEVLDFETDTGVSFRQRGDGVQAAYIPAILKFLADSPSRIAVQGKTAATSVWAYEEPENNLEFSRAFSIAEQLSQYSAMHQIFLTTHSPAFYVGKSPTYSPQRFLVQMPDKVSQISAVHDSTHLHDAIGLMPLIAPFVQKVQTELDAAREKLRSSSTPTIYVSGITDKKYVLRALEIFDPLRATQIAVDHVGHVSTSGSKGSGDSNLDKIVTVFRENPKLQSRRIVILFDCDAGEKESEFGSLRLQPIPHNTKNRKQTIGIENAIDSAAFTSDCYVSHTSISKYGEETTFQKFQKVAACEAVCLRHESLLLSDFVHLQPVLKQALDFLLPTHNVNVATPPSA